MIVRICPECGYTNLRFTRRCGGCGHALDTSQPKTGDFFGDVISVAVCLGLLALAIFGFVVFLQYLQPVFQDLLPQ